MEGLSEAAETCRGYGREQGVVFSSIIYIIMLNVISGGAVWPYKDFSNSRVLRQ